MPRFVRPAYIRVSADGVRSEPSTGPRSLYGWLYAALTLRTVHGDVSDTIRLSAGGPNGSAHITIPASGFAISVNGAEAVEFPEAFTLDIRPVR